MSSSCYHKIETHLRTRESLSLTNNRNAQLEGERLSLQEGFEKEKQRRKQELNEKENA